MNKNSTVVNNIIYNVLSQMVTLIVPLITAPYIARIFNADIIGIYSYSLANSAYFALLANLGFALYGQLKVAALRDDKEALSCFFFELFYLKIILLAFSVLLYYLIVVCNTEGLYRSLSIIMLFNIIASGLDVTWFFNGLEMFKLTAVRNVIIRLINLILIFVFVTDQGAIIEYALIMQVTAFAFSMLLIPYALKHVVFIPVSQVIITRHFIPSFVYFVPGLVNTIFASSDKTMLGIMTNNYEVGVYEQANKISRICLSAISAIGNVILPRATYLHSNASINSEVQEKRLMNNSLSLILFVSMPVTFCICSIADDFVNLFFGPGYEKSGILLSILSFNVLFACVGNILGQQGLIARNKQGEYNYTIILSACINVFLNFMVIRFYASIGAAIASVVAGVLICIFIIQRCNDMISYKDIAKISWKYLIVSLIMYIAIISINPLIDVAWINVLVEIMIYATIYLLILYLLKDLMIIMLLDYIRKGKSHHE